MTEVVKFPGVQVRDVAGLDPSLHPKIFVLVGLINGQLKVQYFYDVFHCLKAVDDLDGEPLHFGGWCLADGPEAIADGLNEIEQKRLEWLSKS